MIKSIQFKQHRKFAAVDLDRLRAGDTYQCISTKTIFVLSQVDYGKYALVSLPVNGYSNRFKSPAVAKAHGTKGYLRGKVSDIFGNDPDDFTPVTLHIDVENQYA